MQLSQRLAERGIVMKPESGIRVVLADADPISRYVLSDALRSAPNIRLVGAVDSRLPVEEWPAERPDVAILVAGLREDHIGLARKLVADEICVVLIGVGWTWHRIDAAFATGVAACLLKESDTEHLGVATTAAASGHVVISPELVVLYASGPGHANGQDPVRAIARRRSLDAVDALTARERQVLTSLSDGMSTSEVATCLGVSPATVKSHVSHALAKLGVRNRLEAVLLTQRALAHRR